MGIGSTNFSSGAFQSNYELFAFLEGPGILRDFSAIFDSDWNPQNDLQAQASCKLQVAIKSHRIYVKSQIKVRNPGTMDDRFEAANDP